MTKSELIDAIHEKAGDQDITLTKKATGELLDIVFTTISGSIKKEKRFSYPGFGTFTVKHRKAREGRNPRTKEPIKIPASNNVGFKAAPALKELVN